MKYTVRNVNIEDEDTIEVISKKFRDGIKEYPADTAVYLVQLSIAYRMKADYIKSVAVANEVMKFFEGKTELSGEDKRMISEAKHVIADGVDIDEDEDEESLGYWLEIFNDDPNYESMERVGTCYFDLGQYDKAEEYYFMILSEDVPWNVDTYVELMTALYKKMGKKKNIQKDIYDKVFAYYDAELAKNPELPEHHKILGDLVVAYYNLEKESKAEKLDAEKDELVYTAMKDLDKYEHFLWNEANQCANNGKPELSALIFEKYLPKKEKGYSDEIRLNFHLNIADSFKDGNNFPKAIEHYLVVLEEIRNSEKALLGLGTCYFLMGKKDIAKPYLQRYAELYTAKDPRALSSLAICFMEEKDYENAIDFFEQAAKLDNGKEEGFQAIMYGGIGTIYSKNLNDYPNAFNYYRMSMELKPSKEVLGEINLHVLNMSFKPQGHDLATKFWKDFPQNKDIVQTPPPLTQEEIEKLPYYYKNLKHHSEPDYDDYLDNMEDEIINEMNTNPGMVEYLQKFFPASSNKFKRHYAEHKVKIILGGEYYSDIDGNKRSLDIYHAKNAFKLILQKKLFNKQILWRAGNIDLPGIEFSEDFDIWREQLETCPFLEEVTSQEVELLKRFMMEDFYSGETKYWLHSWQDYDGFMEEDEDGDHIYMPEWYSYYDSNLGTGALLSLIDVRGPKEKFYHDLWVKDFYNQPKPQPVPGAVPQKYVPPPTRFYEFMKDYEYEEFISKFENDYIKLMQKGWKYRTSSTIENYPKETIKEAIETLEKADEQITLRSDMIWYEAIYFAAMQYRNKQIIEDLDSVFEEYLMKKALPEGIDMNDEESESRKNLHETMMNSRNTKADQIMKGRELNGEPRDFSFLNIE